jgi:hypothetical protein
MIITSKLRLIALLISTAFIVACSSEYGYSRTAFNGKLIDRNIEAAQESAGKADAIEDVNPETKVLVFRKKTFDQENGNTKDASVRATFKKSAKGVFEYASVEFVPES